MEITPEHEPSSDDKNSSCSESEAELLTTITTPASRQTFSLLPEADRVALRKKRPADFPLDMHDTTVLP